VAGHIALAIALAFALYICWLIVQPFVNVLLWATVLTIVFYPLHRRIRLGVRQPEAAAALSTVLVIVLILIPITFVTIAIVRELRDVAEMLQANVQQVGGPTIPGLASCWTGWTATWTSIRSTAQKFLAERMQVWGAALAGSTLVVVGGALGALVQMASSCSRCSTCSGTATASGPPSTNILPLERVQVLDITARTKEVIAATIYGVLVIAAIQGTLGHVHLLGAGSAVAAAVGRGDVRVVHDSDGRRVPGVGPGGAVPGGHRQLPPGRNPGRVGRAGHRFDRQPVVAAARRAAREAARTADLLRRARRPPGLRNPRVVLGPVVVAVTLAIIEMVRQVFMPVDEALAADRYRAGTRDVTPMIRGKVRAADEFPSSHRSNPWRSLTRTGAAGTHIPAPASEPGYPSAGSATIASCS
jgi:hypothetical protein